MSRAHNVEIGAERLLKSSKEHLSLLMKWLCMHSLNCIFACVLSMHHAAFCVEKSFEYSFIVSHMLAHIYNVYRLLSKASMDDADLSRRIRNLFSVRAAVHCFLHISRDSCN